MLCPQGPPRRAKRGTMPTQTKVLQIHLEFIPPKFILLLWFFFFFTFPKFDLKGFYDSKCLKIFDMWDKAQTFNTEKMADRELPFCQCCLPLLLLFCINMQLEVHRKFVQFSGMIWRCLIFSFVHLLVHAGLICFVFFLWHSFLLGVWECLNLKDNTNLFFKWIYQFILFQSIFKMSINPCALQYLV